MGARVVTVDEVLDGHAVLDIERLDRVYLITRTPGRNLYTLTSDGLAFAIFYTNVHDRLLRPLLAVSQPQAPPMIAAALRIIDRHIDNRLADARMPKRQPSPRNSRQLSKI